MATLLKLGKKHIFPQNNCSIEILCKRILFLFRIKLLLPGTKAILYFGLHFHCWLGF